MHAKKEIILLKNLICLFLKIHKFLYYFKMMMKSFTKSVSIFALFLSVSIAAVSATGDEAEVPTIEELEKFQNELQDILPNDEPYNFVEEYHQHQHRVLQDDEESYDKCGIGKPPCPEDFTCMPMGFRRVCVPMKCFEEIAMDYRTSVLTDDFIQSIFARAGVTRQDIIELLMSQGSYRRDPMSLMGTDNAFSKFQKAFDDSAPDLTEPLLRSMDCMGIDPTDDKAPSKEGVTLLIGISYGGGAGIRLDFENTWGTGSADIITTANNQTINAAIPSSYFGLSVSGFLGLNLDVVATFSWAFTGTKEDIPFNYLIWGGRAGVLFPHVAVEGLCLFPGNIPGVQLEAGFGALGGLNLGYKKVWTALNGTAVTNTTTLY